MRRPVDIDGANSLTTKWVLSVLYSMDFGLSQQTLSSFPRLWTYHSHGRVVFLCRAFGGNEIHKRLIGTM